MTDADYFMLPFGWEMLYEYSDDDYINRGFNINYRYELIDFEYSESDEKSIANVFIGFKVQFYYVTDIPLTNRGKFKFIEYT